MTSMGDAIPKFSKSETLSNTKTMFENPKVSPAKQILLGHI